LSPPGKKLTTMNEKEIFEKIIKFGKTISNPEVHKEIMKIVDAKQAEIKQVMSAFVNVATEFVNGGTGVICNTPLIAPLCSASKMANNLFILGNKKIEKLNNKLETLNTNSMLPLSLNKPTQLLNNKLESLKQTQLLNNSLPFNKPNPLSITKGGGIQDMINETHKIKSRINKSISNFLNLPNDLTKTKTKTKRITKTKRRRITRTKSRAN